MWVAVQRNSSLRIYCANSSDFILLYALFSIKVSWTAALFCLITLASFEKGVYFFQEGQLVEKSMNYASAYQFLWLYSTFFSVILCDVFSIGIFRHPQRFSCCKIAYSEELSMCWQKSSYSESSQGVSCSCCLSLSFSQQSKTLYCETTSPESEISHNSTVCWQ